MFGRHFLFFIDPSHWLVSLYGFMTCCGWPAGKLCSDIISNRVVWVGYHWRRLEFNKTH